MNTDLCDILQRFLERVWNQGDIDAADEYIAPSYVIRHDPGDPWDGRTLDIEGFKERVRVSRAPFPDQRFKIEDMIPGDGRVAVSWLWQATHQGDVPGFPANGKTIVMSGVTVYSFISRKISGHWQVCDRLGVFQQLSAAVRN